MKPTLLVLAAGMGSRYGGLKQMDGVGPCGETIIDYSIYDAVQAGFGKVVYVVREYFKEQMREKCLEKYASVKCQDGTPLQFEFVTQELDKIPAPYRPLPEREKPWGTAHAVLMAKDVIKEPFAVINGDDYYGRDSFNVLGKFLRDNACSKGKFSLVGFPLDHTLSESGGVSRGICSSDSTGYLTKVEECHNIRKEADGKCYGDNSVTGAVHEQYCGSSPVSMNMWGFTPDYFDLSLEVFKEFLAQNVGELKKEFYIPFAIDRMIHSGTATCEVLKTTSHWFGVTFKEDRPGVVAKFRALADDGTYPSPLYGPAR